MLINCCDKTNQLRTQCELSCQYIHLRGHPCRGSCQNCFYNLHPICDNEKCRTDQVFPKPNQQQLIDQVKQLLTYSPQAFGIFYNKRYYEAMKQYIKYCEQYMKKLNTNSVIVDLELECMKIQLGLIKEFQDMIFVEDTQDEFGAQLSNILINHILNEQFYKLYDGVYYHRRFIQKINTIKLYCGLRNLSSYVLDSMIRVDQWKLHKQIIEQSHFLLDYNAFMSITKCYSQVYQIKNLEKQCIAL